MTLRLTLTEKPDGAFLLASDYLYAGPAYKAPHFFVVEPKRGNNVQTSYLTRDQARQLRDELTTFLGDGLSNPISSTVVRLDHHEKVERENQQLRDCLEESERQYQAKTEEIVGLLDANEALRRDNDDLTRQAERARKQRDAAIADYNALNEETEKLRQRVASLERDADDRRRAFETLFPINPFRWTK